MLKRNLVLAGASALVSSLLAAPIAADIIAYRTEDGVFAYTDDRDKVPARYAADAVTVRDSALHDVSAPHARGHAGRARGDGAPREAARLSAPAERGVGRRARGGRERGRARAR